MNAGIRVCCVNIYLWFQRNLKVWTIYLIWYFLGENTIQFKLCICFKSTKRKSSRQWAKATITHIRCKYQISISAIYTECTQIANQVVYNYHKDHNQELMYVVLYRVTSLKDLFLTNKSNDFTFFHAYDPVYQGGARQIPEISKSLSTNIHHG